MVLDAEKLQETDVSGGGGCQRGMKTTNVSLAGRTVGQPGFFVGGFYVLTPMVTCYINIASFTFRHTVPSRQQHPLHTEWRVLSHPPGLTGTIIGTGRGQTRLLSFVTLAFGWKSFAKESWISLSVIPGPLLSSCCQTSPGSHGIS